MKLEKASFDKFEERIIFYKGKTLQELKFITPKWAYADNIDKILDSTLHPKTNEYLIFNVDTEELFKKSELYEVNNKLLFTEESLNDGRVATILYRWDNGLFIDPPTIGTFDFKSKKLSFSDGRHRSKTAYFLGCEKIPIAIHKSQVEEVEKLIKLLPV